MAAAQEHQDGRLKFSKRKESSYRNVVEMPEEKEKKGVLIHHQKVILILLLKYFFIRKHLDIPVTLSI